ncbi:hypothetical protein M426DRAFT_28338 [Hypoxylon sp. CI-4A]|nr:hypothetical protein M426DRAFT_28338 [Hypoxylon sp. CI-4A]
MTRRLQKIAVAPRPPSMTVLQVASLIPLLKLTLVGTGIVLITRGGRPEIRGQYLPALTCCYFNKLELFEHVSQAGSTLETASQGFVTMIIDALLGLTTPFEELVNSNSRASTNRKRASGSSPEFTLDWGQEAGSETTWLHAISILASHITHSTCPMNTRQAQFQRLRHLALPKKMQLTPDLFAEVVSERVNCLFLFCIRNEVLPTGTPSAGTSDADEKSNQYGNDDNISGFTIQSGA